MTLKDLRGKTVKDLEQVDFEKLFCRHCKDCGRCVKDPKTVNACRALVDSGAWDRDFRKRQD